MPSPVTEYPYFVIVTPGLERVAEDEIRSLSRRVNVGPEAPGLLIFDANIHPEDLLRLRCVEDVYATLAVLQPLRSDPTGPLQVFRAAHRSPLWDDALEAHRLARPNRKRRITYRVVAQLAGHHEYRRVDLRSAVEDAIDHRTKEAWDRVDENASIEVWVRGEGDRAAIGIRLSDATMRHRDYKLAQLPASLKPTVAAAMVRLTRPGPDEVFLDPMCGSGTILIERARAGRYAQLLGGDADPKALEATLANVGPRYQPIRIEQMDARRLPFETASVDKVATNLPFGRRIGDVEDLPLLYAAVFRELARVVKPGGRAVLLLANEGRWRDLLKRQPKWKLRQQYRVSLLGQRPVLLVLDRIE